MTVDQSGEHHLGNIVTRCAILPIFTLYALPECIYMFINLYQSLYHQIRHGIGITELFLPWLYLWSIFFYCLTSVEKFKDRLEKNTMIMYATDGPPISRLFLVKKQFF